jgi:hypothetical protein
MTVVPRRQVHAEAADLSATSPSCKRCAAQLCTETGLMSATGVTSMRCTQLPMVAHAAAQTTLIILGLPQRAVA